MRLRMTMVGALALLVAACGDDSPTDGPMPDGGGLDAGSMDGGGGDGDAGPGDGGVDGGPADEAAPTVALVFPSGLAATGAATLIIRGTASDPSGVATVSVAGVAATSDDDFGTWSAEVPLAWGANDLSIEAEDSLGNRDEAATLRVVRREEITNPQGARFDAASGLIYALEPRTLQIVRMDPATGAMERVVSLESFAEGGVGKLPVDFVFDGAANRLLVGAREDSTTRTAGIWAYDLDGETWSPVSDASTGSGEALQDPLRLAFDPAEARLFAADAARDAILEVDLTNGNRSILSSNTEPSGSLALFDDIIDVAYDGAGRVIVLDRGTDAVIAVDAASGAKTVLADSSTGDTIFGPLGLGVDPAGERIFFSHGSTIYEVAWDGGSHEAMSVNTEEPSTLLGDVRRVLVDPSGGRLLVIDTRRDRVVAIALADGARTLLFDDRFPIDGPLPTTTSTHAAGGALYFAREGEIVELSAAGAQSAVGSGEAVSNGLVVLRVDLASGKAYAGGAGFIVELDLATGVDRIVTMNADGDPLRLDIVEEILVDAERGRLLVSDDTEVLWAVDLETGDKSVLSSGAVPDTTLPLNRITGMALDGAGDRVILADDDYEHLIAVDLETGARTAIGSASAGIQAYDTRGLAMQGDSVLLTTRAELLRVSLASGEATVLRSYDTVDRFGLGTATDLYTDGAAVFLQTEQTDGTEHVYQFDVEPKTFVLRAH